MSIFFLFSSARVHNIFVFFCDYGFGLRLRDHLVFNEETNVGVGRIQSENVESIVFRRIGQQSSPFTAAKLKYDRTPVLLIIDVIEYFYKTHSNTILNCDLDDRGSVENRDIILHQHYYLS